jgi:hypothetical protein
MELAVVGSANRDDEFVAYPSSECAGLCEGEMMRIRRHPAADKAGLPQHELPVVLIAQPNRFTKAWIELLGDRFRLMAAAF